MVFDIGIGIHIESELNMFRFVDDISSKMEVFPMPEIWGGRDFMQNRQFQNTWPEIDESEPRFGDQFAEKRHA
jgi:hypothetical protein